MVRAFDRWLIPYLLRRPAVTEKPVHLLLAVCDHFEPLHHSDETGALGRIGQWSSKWPELSKQFRDADGCQPKHTFFYPSEQYSGKLLDPIARICKETGSEVEIHLHHENDTGEGLSEALELGKQNFLEHGLLGRDEEGKTRFGFIHGNWALNNSHPLGEGCGVDREIPILRSAGCYADFTMPSAPSPTQSKLVNGIGYLQDLPGKLALEQIEPSRVGEAARRSDSNQLLMIQGPLALNWGWRKWGIFPKMENGDITGANPPTSNRLRLSAKQRISVEGRPDWVFVKFHTHGGIESNFSMLLGEAFQRFHEYVSSSSEFILHYVSAREMANLVHAAEDGVEGDPSDYRDYVFGKPEAVS